MKGEEPQELKSKVVFLGGSGVGKSSIIHTYFEGSFLAAMPNTIGTAFQSRTFEPRPPHRWARHVMHVWDTSGQEKFFAITNIYYRDANAVVLVVDCTDEGSLAQAERFLRDLRLHLTKKEFVVLAINKADLLPGFVPGEPDAEALLVACPFGGQLRRFIAAHAFAAVVWTTATRPDSVRRVFSFIDARVGDGTIPLGAGAQTRRRADNPFLLGPRPAQPAGRDRSCCS